MVFFLYLQEDYLYVMEFSLFKFELQYVELHSNSMKRFCDSEVINRINF